MPSCSPDCCLLRAVEVRDARVSVFLLPAVNLCACLHGFTLPPPSPPPCFQNFPPASQSYFLLKWGSVGRDRVASCCCCCDVGSARIGSRFCCHFPPLPHPGVSFLVILFLLLGGRERIRTCAVSPPCLWYKSHAPETLLRSPSALFPASSLPVNL